MFKLWRKFCDNIDLARVFFEYLNFLIKNGELFVDFEIYIHGNYVMNK